MEEKKKQPRKQYAKHGESQLKMMSFRFNERLRGWLKMQPNAGNYINRLIEADALKHGYQLDDDETMSKPADYEV